MTNERDTPTQRECVLLYLAHFIRTGGRGGDEPEEDIFGQPTYTVTPWRIEVKVATWSFNTYGKRSLGSSLRRRWREIREEPQEVLTEMGVDLTPRPPTGDDELDSYNLVWDLTVDMDTFEDAVQERSPFTDYPF